ncbi:MAG TPA: GMC family oxidoreductase [Candidatus Baltobacteraceae bacterium]|jgi:choline dehydrogenase-like flavoprotein|nr:GMC family oxidoreductase [Candidatus Baltobacteraceae bacterium]
MIHDASLLTKDLLLEGDVAIVGTGAGGGTAAEILSHAGLRVILIEEGALRSARDFHMLEREAYPDLYQESAARKTKDKGITILQGRTVGGSTTVNWTSSFRTPPETLEYWRTKFGLSGYSPDALAPWFERMEQRLNIHPWPLPPNENNAALQRGAAKLGIATHVIPRNVKGCWNLGYCGMGCPTNAKQSMLITTIPSALRSGAVLVTRARAERISFAGSRASEVVARALRPDGITPSPYAVTVRAAHIVLAGGAIGTPALLLRSEVPDPYARIGKRTFLHPVAVSTALFGREIRAFSGAPQSIYSDHFLHTQSIDGPIGYKLEVPPIHPVLMSTAYTGFGVEHARVMAQAPHAQAIIALMRDGFHESSPGGSVGLRGDGTPVLDYPITPYVWDGLRRSLDTMAQIQFSAGARSVMPLHENARAYRSFDEARAAIAALPMEILRMRVMSAHVMGGSAMGTDEKASVVDAGGRFHHLENVFVFDGSVFPTSVGANPQLSIYGITARNASRLAEQIGGNRLTH